MLRDGLIEEVSYVCMPIQPIHGYEVGIWASSFVWDEVGVVVVQVKNEPLTLHGRIRLDQ